MQEPETKECGLEDENAGETLSDRPLVLRPMAIVSGYPPMIDEMVAKFGVRIRHGVIFSWGDRIYNPDRIQIPPQLVKHELVHGARQIDDIEGWWKRYIDDDRFRLAEEIPAHQAELKWLVENAPSRQLRRNALKITAQRLAAPLYGNMISTTNARKALRA